MKYFRIRLLYLSLCVLIPLISGCGADKGDDDNGLGYEQNICPDFVGWRFRESGTDSGEWRDVIQFLGGGVLFVADAETTPDSGWIGFRCENGQFLLDSGQEAYLIWSDDQFATLKLAPMEDLDSFTLYEFDGAF